MPAILRTFASKDPHLLVVKRSVRAAVVMPVAFALTHHLFSNPQVSLFGAFGSFALLIFVEFTGTVRARLESYGALFVAGGCFIVVGTVASTHKVAAVVAMGLVGFGILYAGLSAPGVATASTAALLTFVLPVAVAQPASAVGPQASRLGDRRRPERDGLPRGVAPALARRPPAAAWRRPSARWPGWPIAEHTGQPPPPASVPRRLGTTWLASWPDCEPSSPERPTRRPVPPPEPWPSPSWSGGSNGWLGTRR